MNRIQRRPRRMAMLLAAGAATMMMAVACNSVGTNTPTGNNNDNAPDENVTLNESLGSKGTLSGKAVDSRTTRESTEDTSAAQAAPPDFDTENSQVLFFDVAGNRLLDENGEVYPPVPVQSDGTFIAENLPVGVDFTACIDIGNDDICDIETCVNIPSENGGEEGTLDNVKADPLTTLVLARLRGLMKEQGIDPQDLPISPVAVVTRIVQAYTHLFEEAGIDQEIDLSDIDSVTRESLAELFNQLIPGNARNGMDIVEGNLQMARGRDAEQVAIGAAKVFLRAGFPIADPPEGLDLSSLADVDGVEVTTIADLYTDFVKGEEFFEGDSGQPLLDGLPDSLADTIIDEFPDGLPDGVNDLGDLGDLGDLLDFLPAGFSGATSDQILTPAEVGQLNGSNITVYYIPFSEPDRNFSEEEEEAGAVHILPAIGEPILLQMARLKLQGRTITLQDLFDVLTSVDEGLGLRLTYFVNDPNFAGPPLTVFETANGRGKAVNMDRLFARVFEEGYTEFTEESFDRQEVDFRNTIRELLADTTPPTFERLFRGFMKERVGGMEELSRDIRQARAHLPFSRSGPSTFFVVADGDPFQFDFDEPAAASAGVRPVTVDVDMTIDGVVRQVTYNSTGEGKFWLGFTPRTDEKGFVELITREAGKPLHGPRGPLRLNMNNRNVFGNIDGQPFADFVSDSGTFYPGVDVSVLRRDFVPDQNAQSDQGPNQKLYVLANGLGFHAEPVRVDYDPVTGTVTYNPFGRHFLMFLPDSHITGEFGLFNEDTGREARREDPNALFNRRPEKPENFEEFFNEFDDFAPPPGEEFTDFNDFQDFVDGVFDQLPPPPDDGLLPPPDGGVQPPDGDFPPPDGNLPPPPDDNLAPPDDNLPPPPEDDLGFDGNDTQGSGDAGVSQVADGDPNQPPIDGSQPPPPGDFPPPDGNVQPPPDNERPPVLPDGNLFVEDDFVPPPINDGFFDGQPITVFVGEIAGLQIALEEFNHVYGVEVPNVRYNPDGDPYYDDVNGNSQQDASEPTAPFRPTLFDPSDWRSTDVQRYYRRADNDQPVTFDNIDWESDTPRTMDGITMVPRDFKPRLNAFRFGRPNTTINLLTAFTPPEFFNGTKSLNAESRVDVFTAVAIVNLMMEQVYNVEADIDIDGLGPQPRIRELVDANLWMPPLDDPFILILKGIRDRTQVTEPPAADNGTTDGGTTTN